MKLLCCADVTEHDVGFWFLYYNLDPNIRLWCNVEC